MVTEHRWHDECGVFGVVGHPRAASQVFLGLYALQHRGQESAGIVAYDGRVMREVKKLGLVWEALGEEDLEGLPGQLAIGHNRYSTTGSSRRLPNVQPLLVDFKGGQLSLAHNGNLVNAFELRTRLEEEGAIFQSSTDSEVIVHLLARSREGTIPLKLCHALQRVKGAYSLVLASSRELVGARDPHGFRPLCLGQVGDAWVLSSESCALDIIGARLVREIEPGEMVILNEKGLHSLRFQPPRPARFCVFEFIYFCRPDSIVGGISVDAVRRELGRRLARTHPSAGDLVISVPDSSNSAALGYAVEAGLPYELGLIRNHYVGRTFISPAPAARTAKARIKYNPVADILRGRRVVVVDDSIVRGTTSRLLVQMMRQAGAREVHLRVSSPPIRWPCFYGIDTPTRGELIASSHSVEETAAYLEVDSLGYLPLGELLSAGGYAPDHYCSACFDGEYPVPWGPEPAKEILEHREDGSPPVPSSPDRS